MAGVTQAPHAVADVVTFDLAKQPVRSLNQFLHHGLGATMKVLVLNPDGAHNEGDASLRCGISMKGVDIVVGGSVGDFSAFMAQAGRLVVCGDAGDALGDSLYEAVIYVRGKVKSMGADAHEEPMAETDYDAVKNLLAKAGLKHDPRQFRRVASKRELYHWNADANQEY